MLSSEHDWENLLVIRFLPSGFFGGTLVRRWPSAVVRGAAFAVRKFLGWNFENAKGPRGSSPGPFPKCYWVSVSYYSVAYQPFGGT